MRGKIRHKTEADRDKTSTTMVVYGRTNRLTQMDDRITRLLVPRRTFQAGAYLCSITF